MAVASFALMWRQARPPIGADTNGFVKQVVPTGSRAAGHLADGAASRQLNVSLEEIMRRASRCVMLNVQYSGFYDV